MSLIIKKVWSGNIAMEAKIEDMGSQPQFSNMTEHRSCYLVEYYNPVNTWKFFWTLEENVGEEGIFITNAMKEDPPKNGERYWNDAGEDKMVYSTTLTLSSSLKNNGLNFLYRQHFETWTGAFMGYLDEVKLWSLPSIWIKTFEENISPKKENNLDLKMKAWENSNAGNFCAGIGFIIQNILKDSGLWDAKIGKNMRNNYNLLCISSMDEILRENVRLGHKEFKNMSKSEWTEIGHAVGLEVVKLHGYNSEQEVFSFLFDSLRGLTDIDRHTMNEELKDLWAEANITWATITAQNLDEENKFYNIGLNVFLLHISQLIEFSPEDAKKYNIPGYSIDSFPERPDILNWTIYAIQAMFVDLGWDIPPYENICRCIVDTVMSDYMDNISLDPDLNSIGAYLYYNLVE